MRCLLISRASVLALGCLFAWTNMTALYAQESPIDVRIQVLKRWDLPDTIPGEILQAHYAVLRLTLKNNGAVPVGIQPDDIMLHAAKGKPLKPSLSSQVMSDIFNTGIYKQSGPGGGVHGEAGVGYPGSYPADRPPYGGPRLDPEPAPTGDKPGVISVDRGPRLREALERERFTTSSLPPGQTATGLLYFKTKKKTTELSGHTLAIPRLDGKPVSAKIP